MRQTHVVGVVFYCHPHDVAAYCLHGAARCHVYRLWACGDAFLHMSDRGVILAFQWLIIGGSLSRSAPVVRHEAKFAGGPTVGGEAGFRSGVVSCYRSMIMSSSSGVVYQFSQMVDGLGVMVTNVWKQEPLLLGCAVVKNGEGI